MSVIHWGDVPAWAGAIFAASAAGAAIWTLASQRAQLSEQQQFIGEQRKLMAEQSATLALERAERLAVAKARRLEQARHIEAAKTTDRFARMARLFITNRSSAPITDVHVKFGELAPGWVSEGDSGYVDKDRGNERPHPLPTIGPSRTFCFAAYNDVEVPGGLAVAAFTDDSGVRWQLDEHGNLEEMPSDPTAPLPP
ncbi:MAG: hypothetical protein JF597_23025 [Streptomyces sp.]|uniref:hypothetical protein n=1 Tax=Streptomyces sp. TaxID=1931 RepID=UPI0025F7A423|nr:hypothetical protein [Streptomyces sp.]MBW8796363.1 hypothetical protein [Streptomyces sp.]